MTRPSVARLALAILAVVLLWTGISFVSQQELTVWTDVAVDGDIVTSEGTSVSVYALGLVLLAVGLLVTATILVFEAYVRAPRAETGAEEQVPDAPKEAAA